MKPERIEYDALLQSLADGIELDWSALDLAATTAAERRRYRNLRLVARVAQLHRTFVGDAPPPDAAAQQPHDTPAPGVLTAWGHLEVRERIDGGAYGDVYLAHDPQLHRDVALKLLRVDASARQPLDRVLAEGRALARVRHPNVVTVHGADVRDGRAGLWMELVEGRTLESVLQAHGVLGAGEATAVAIDLCRALAAVHAAGLVHADVKAHNVMREQGGRIVLMDFGAGHVQGVHAALAGTPLYLSPEVLAGEPATPRSDIYSLGVLLFHMLTGKYPFAADDLDGLRAAHADGVRSWLRDLRPDLPNALVQIVERALERDPSERFATAGEMERDLVPATNAAHGRTRPTGAWIVAFGATVVATTALLLAVPELGTGSASRLSSVAVLPFAAAAAADDADPRVSGLTTDVIRELQRFDVEVKGATTGSGIRMSGALEPRLGAAGIVRGEWRRVGARSTVHVDVLRAGGAQFWSRDYDVDAAVLPALAVTIGRDVALAVGASPRQGAPSSPQPANQAAYDAYQRGRLLLDEREKTSIERSIEYFTRAAALDPAYAQPWAGLSDAYIALGVSAFGPLTPLEARARARDAALKALERDADSAEAQTSLAFASYFHDWNWADAEGRFKKAIALNPQYALAHHWYSDYLTATGRFAEASDEIDRAKALEPLSISIDRDIAWPLFFQRRYDEAIAHLEGTLRLDRNYAAAHTLLARALAERGRYPEAIDHLRRAEPFLSRGVFLSFMAYVHALSGDDARADASMAEIDAHRGDWYVPPYYLALVYAAQGRARVALDALDTAYREQDPTLVNLRSDPRFDRIRSEPRFTALVARMRFPAPPA